MRKVKTYNGKPLEKCKNKDNMSFCRYYAIKNTIFTVYLLRITVSYDIILFGKKVFIKNTTRIKPDVQMKLGSNNI